MDVAGVQNARLGLVYLWQGTTLDSPLAQAVSSRASAAKDPRTRDFGLRGLMTDLLRKGRGRRRIRRLRGDA